MTKKRIDPSLLSEDHREMLKAIVEFVNDHGYGPGVRELAEACGLSSNSTLSVRRRLDYLEEVGFIERDPHSPRSIRVLFDAGGWPLELKYRPAQD